MSTIFLVVSFLLHLISIFAIVVLYQRRALERVSLPSMQDDVETIHQSIESFVDELEKENEVLYEKLLQYVKKNEKEWEERLYRIELRHNAHENSTEPKQTTTQDSSGEENEQARETKPIKPTKQKKQTKQADNFQNQNKDPKFQQALELYNQGFSADQIAKVLNIGKGEANLIINMIDKSRQYQN